MTTRSIYAKREEAGGSRHDGAAVDPKGCTRLRRERQVSSVLQAELPGDAPQAGINSL